MWNLQMHQGLGLRTYLQKEISSVMVITLSFVDNNERSDKTVSRLERRRFSQKTN